MNNKTIIEFCFRIIWRIMEIEEGVIRGGRTQPHSLINVVKITYIFLTKKEKKKILILAPLNPFRFFGSLYISKEWTSSIKTIASIIGLPPRRIHFAMFLYAISFTFPLLLWSKRTIYRATVRPDLRTTVQWNPDKTINDQGQEIYFRSTL